VNAFGDSRLVVQQILEEYRCLDGTINSYLQKCWDIIHFLTNSTFGLYLGFRIAELTIWRKMHHVIG
jgi:hypothetical protein